MERAVGSIVVATFLALTLVWSPSMVVAEDLPPPAVGATILEDALTGPVTIKPSTCRTRRAGYDYVGEGLRLSVTGACNDGDVFAGMGPTIRGLTMADGEIRLEVKAVSGAEHLRFGINARSQPFTPGALSAAATVPASYAAAIEPGLGRALIGKTPDDAIHEQTDLGELISRDDWNTIAMRLQGPNVWLLVNDRPVLAFSDGSLDRGEVLFSVLKLSDGPDRSKFDQNDMSEVAVVVRNLKVSALAEGDPARMPTYQRP